ncbi:Sucrase-isomaltase, intestinal, partial [Trichinella britovi]
LKRMNTQELLKRRWVPYALLAFAALVILIILLAVYVPSGTQVPELEQIDEQVRVDCHPDPNPTEDACHRRGCVWLLATGNWSAPSCYYPTSFGYAVTSEQPGLLTLTRREILGEVNPLSKPVKQLQVQYEFFNDQIVHVKITDATVARYEVPVPLWPKGKPQAQISSNRLQFVVLGNHPTFAFAIHDQQRTLFNTSIGGLVYADQFLQIATYLSSWNLYGFGENLHTNLKHDLSTFRTWPMFSRDQPPVADPPTAGNLYGVHPFYMQMNDDGSSHGVLFFNSGAQEYTTGPGPSLVYRTIGGILDMYFFVGPQPGQVIQQYQTLIGYPAMPAYWSLGFQLCRYGYHNTSEVEELVKRMRALEIPQDVQYVDIDYMDKNKDFTIDSENFKDLPELVNKTKENGLRWIFILDPAINVASEQYPAFHQGKQSNVFVTWPDEKYVPPLNANYTTTVGTKIMLGTVWPFDNVAFPDFLNPKTHSWWKQQIVTFHNVLNFDGIWIDMNEPANFGTNEDTPWYVIDPNLKHLQQLRCPNNTYDTPPYATQAAYYWKTTLNDKTICMIGEHSDGVRKYRHYDVHSLYGWSETKPTIEAVQKATGKRGVVITRSTFPTSGQFSGHWLGDNFSKWADLAASIIGILEFNMFGIPYVGADICGFEEDADEEMCARWQQLGAFYPFSRNHNGKNRRSQDPTQWQSVAEATKASLKLRYYFLPYLYTLFYKAHTKGETVVRSLFFEFPNDPNTHHIDKQFLWGPAVLITPVLQAGVVHTEAYFPTAQWYNVYEAEIAGALQQPGRVTISSPRYGCVPVHVRGGYILPRQKPALNTRDSRTNPLDLLITVDKNNNTSVGELFWDNGESIMINESNSYFFHIQYIVRPTNAKIQITVKHAPHADYLDTIALPTLDRIEIFGAEHSVDLKAEINLDGMPISLTDSNVQFNVNLKKLIIQKDNFWDLKNSTAGQIRTLSWQHKLR